MIINNYFQYWCATEVDKNGIFHGDRTNLEDPWGYCHPLSDMCPKHEETLTWRRDETVKMTLQYNNPALWAGLELYGNLLTCCLLYSVILTAFTLAISKIFRKISHDCYNY